MPAHERHFKQRTLGNKAELDRQIHEKDGNIHGALVIRAIDGGLSGIQVFNTFHPRPDPACGQDQPGPESREGVLPSATAIE
jgi:hypothetical protein